MRLFVVAATLLLMALNQSGCVACACSTPVIPVRVFAAASLGAALDDVPDQYRLAQPMVRVTVSTGSSAALRTQIEHGAAADVFLSADTINPEALADGGLTHGAPVAFATNRLTIIVPPGNPAGITSAVDLGRANVRIIAAGEEVPIAKYAEELVANLARLPGYSADFATAYASNIRSREDDVGAVTAKIALGEGDAAIVYVTDALAANVASVAVPEEANVVSTYAGVVLIDAASQEEAARFLEWLRGPAGQRILADYGFSPAP